MALTCHAAELRHTFKIPSAPLSQALDDFSKTTKTPVLYDGTLVTNRRSPALEGSYSDTEAIRLLLAGSGLKASLTGQGVIVITSVTRKETNAASAPIQSLAMATPSSQAALPEPTVVVVTGFRTSIANALNIKRRSTYGLDAILSEDLAKFPSNNLAEAMQRIPGVALLPADGGEGRNVTVRGLSPLFARVRIDGLEAASQTGSSDIYGAGNNGRGFDFNVFASDLFSVLTVGKTTTAQTEEGSLGSTIDLKVPKPLDYPRDRMFAFTLRQSENSVAGQQDPRASMIFARKFADGRFGIMSSLTYQRLHTREVGYSAVDVLSAGLSGNGNNALKRDASGQVITDADGNALREMQPFCTPIGWTDPTGGRSISPDPAEYASKGADAANCAFNNPRSGSIDAYNTIYSLRSPLAPSVPGSGAFLPRIPRFLNSTQDETRLGAAIGLEYRPDVDTDMSLDMIYMRYRDLRQDNYIGAISFARPISNNGQPMVSVKEVAFNAAGSLVHGVFNGVDLRSEGLTDRFSTTFWQAKANYSHRFSDRLDVTAALGVSDSTWVQAYRTQLFMDAIDTRDFSIDFDGDTQNSPVLTFGADVNNINTFRYQPPGSTGDILGGFTTQGSPRTNDTRHVTFSVDGKWTAGEAVTVKAGYQFRQQDYNSFGYNLIPSQRKTQAGVDLSAIIMPISGLDRQWGHGAPSQWVAIDPEKWAAAVGAANFTYCGVECGAQKGRIKESTSAAYVMAEFALNDGLAFPVRGDLGVRYFTTDQLAVGYIPVTAPPGALYPTVGRRNEVERTYDGLLPAANLVVELTPDLLLRLSAAKTMARPDLNDLIPNSSVNGVTRTGAINNPLLKPIQASTLDATLEWYFRPGSLLSIGYFHKDISSYIQRINSQIPFSRLGLSNFVLDNTNSTPQDTFTVSQVTNTRGGPLNGVEVNTQFDFDFLPGFWKRFGVLASYTLVSSRIEYVLTSANGVPTSTTTKDLLGLSRNSASGTIYYEDNKFSFRTTAAFRSKYIRNIPAATGSDLQGNSPTLYVDASAAYRINSHVKLICELQNLTDEMNRLYIDSGRRDTLFQTRVGRTITVGISASF